MALEIVLLARVLLVQMRHLAAEFALGALARPVKIVLAAVLHLLDRVQLANDVLVGVLAFAFG